MSSTLDGNSLGNEGLTFNSTPYTWILTPLIVFLALGVLATIIQFQRRRCLRKFGLQRSWPGRDLEANRQTTGHQRPSRNGRWQWTTRTDEGLDEFGEAPPAYQPKAKPGQTLRDASFEMDHVEHAATGAIPPPPPIGAAAGADRDTMPPDYGTATGLASSSTPSPAVASPSPAVTRH